MKKICNLDLISPKTLELWNKVLKKYGPHSYSLGVNGLNEVILSKGYTTELAKGNREAQRVLNELLAK